MTFRRDGKRVHRDARDWEAWKEANRDLLDACGFPSSVLRSREDWEYLLHYGYHCDGSYPNIDFLLDEQSEADQLRGRQGERERLRLRPLEFGLHHP